MTDPTEAEVLAFKAAVECIGLEVETLLEHLGPHDVLTALFVVAVGVADVHRLNAAVVIRIFSKVLDSERDANRDLERDD